MYFACWLALSAPPLTTLLPLSSLYNSLQKTLKIPECSAWILHVIPGCVYYDCIGCWCRHWPLMTGDATLGAGVTTAAREQRRPLALVTWMRTLWVEGDGMWPLHSLSISVQTLGEVTSTQSSQHVIKDWVWQYRGGGTDGSGVGVCHHSVQKFRDRTQRSNNLPKGQPDI